MESTSKRPGIKDTIGKIFRHPNASLILILIVIVVLFRILNERFISATTLKNVLNASTIVGLIAIGETLLIISGNIDLGAGSIGAMAGVACAALMASGMAWPLAVIIVLIIGAVFGALNALLVNIFKMESFIATLATSYIAQGVAYIICGGIAVATVDKGFEFLGTGTLFNIPFSVVIVCALLLVYGIILAKTKFGRNVYMCGGNRTAARLAGLHPKKTTTALFINSSVLSSLAGILLASRLKAGAPSSVIGAEFKGITAAILGGVSFMGGTGTMSGCFIGLLILNTFNNGLTVVGVDSFWQTVAQGALLIVALLLDFYRNRAAKRVK